MVWILESFLVPNQLFTSRLDFDQFHGSLLRSLVCLSVWQAVLVALGFNGLSISDWCLASSVHGSKSRCPKWNLEVIWRLSSIETGSSPLEGDVRIRTVKSDKINVLTARSSVIMSHWSLSWSLNCGFEAVYDFLLALSCQPVRLNLEGCWGFLLFLWPFVHLLFPLRLGSQSPVPQKFLWSWNQMFWFKSE